MAKATTMAIIAAIIVPSWTERPNVIGAERNKVVRIDKTELIFSIFFG
jgi:hypothetical protein